MLSAYCNFLPVIFPFNCTNDNLYFNCYDHLKGNIVTCPFFVKLKSLVFLLILNQLKP